MYGQNEISEDEQEGTNLLYQPGQQHHQMRRLDPLSRLNDAFNSLQPINTQFWFVAYFYDNFCWVDHCSIQSKYN